MTKQPYDVLVVGARVAGSVLAALLGNAGYHVLLVDRSAFPSSTLSTHYFRGGRALTIFQRLGLLDDLLALGAPPLVRQYVYLNGAEAPVIQPPQEPGDVGYCLSIRREALDHFLLQRARAAPTVEVREQTRVTDLVWDNGRVSGARLQSPQGEDMVLAHMVVGADGRHSFVADAVQAPVEESEPPVRAMYYRYVRDFPGPTGPADGAEFSFIGDEIVYVFPSDAGVSCIALSLNLDDYATVRKAAEQQVDLRIARHVGIAGRYTAATQEGRLLGCGPETNYVRVPAGPGWALVGDAGVHQDPWSGQGIDCAAVHASMLTDALHQWFSGEQTETEALATYHRRRNAHALDIYHRTVMIGRDLRQLRTG